MKTEDIPSDTVTLCDDAHDTDLKRLYAKYSQQHVTLAECKRFLSYHINGEEYVDDDNGEVEETVVDDGQDNTRRINDTKSANSVENDEKQTNYAMRNKVDKRNKKNSKNKMKPTKISRSLLLKVERDIQNYVKWRERCGLQHLYNELNGHKIESLNSPVMVLKDSDRWDIAFKHGIRMNEQYHRNNSKKMKNRDADDDYILAQPPSHSHSQVIFEHRIDKNSDDQSNLQETVKDKEGYPIFHVLPARIDKDGYGPGVYSIAFASYLDMYFRRGCCELDDDHQQQENERMTVLFDVRPGRGWSNPPATSMIGYINTIIQNLQGNFPGRLHRLVIYPIPRPALYIWNTIKWAFHKHVVDRIVLVSGSADHVDSPLPTDLLLEWFDEEVLQRTEQFRRSLFRPVDDDD